MIQSNQAVPNATIYEFIAEETPGCTIGPNAFQVSEITKGKKIQPNCGFKLTML